MDKAETSPTSTSTSTSGSSSSDESATPPPTTSPGQQQSSIIAIGGKRRFAPRRGHTKSRTGCNSCKRRRVKCDEALPACGACQRLALACEYGQQAAGSVGLMRATANGLPGQPLRTTPGVLEMIDLRFFHHFLLEAYPPLPILGKELWQHLCQMSHQYEFLGHAILGLGASHLSLTAHNNYSNAALNHRVAAISVLNEQLSKAHLGKAEIDATLAALIALTFQSAYIADGMVEFLTMSRGCVLVSRHKTFKLEESLFTPLGKEAFIEIVRKIVNANDFNHQLYMAFADEFLGSLAKLTALCDSSAELNYLASMNRIVTWAITNPIESFCEKSYIYSQVGDMSTKEFSSFIDPENYSSQLVLLHIFVLDLVMSRKTVDQASDNSTNSTKSQTGFDSRMRITLIWIENIFAHLPEDYQSYGQTAVNMVRKLASQSLTKDGTWKPILHSTETTTTTTTTTIESEEIK